MNATYDERTFYFDQDTPEKVQALLEDCLHRSDQRVRLFFGDPTTGRDWMEEWQVTGTIGRSTGPMHVALLIHNSRSMGGPAILTGNIIRMMINGVEVYRHPHYNLPELTMQPSTEPGYRIDVFAAGELHARFKTLPAAIRWIEFMKGERMTK